VGCDLLCLDYKLYRQIVNAIPIKKEKKEKENLLRNPLPHIDLRHRGGATFVATPYVGRTYSVIPTIF